MNAYGLIVLGALVGGYLLRVSSSLLNVRALDPNLPAEFSDVYDAERYARSQQYTRVTTRFGLLSATLRLVALLAFWFLSGFEWVDVWARGFGFGAIGSGMIFVASLLVAQSVLSLPFTLYAIFVIEARYGFNKTTWKTFVADLIKGAVLAVLLGAPLLAGILWFFEYAGRWGWLLCWAVVTVWTLLIQLVAPTWIMPLFNKFTPLPAGPLRDAILAYAARVSFPLSNVFVIDGSKRSAKANAFFTGFGKNKRIALFDTLVEQQSVQELVAVLAHEVGHYKRGHIVKGVLISIAHTGVIFWLLSLFLGQQGLFDAFFVSQPSVYLGLVLFSLLLSPVELLLSVAMNALSRRHEYEADRYAAETTGRPADLVSGLKKLAQNNLANLTPHSFYAFLNYSHPPLRSRIAALRALPDSPKL